MTNDRFAVRLSLIVQMAVIIIFAVSLLVDQSNFFHHSIWFLSVMAGCQLAQASAISNQSSLSGKEFLKFIFGYLLYVSLFHSMIHFVPISAIESFHTAVWIKIAIFSPAYLLITNNFIKLISTVHSNIERNRSFWDLLD